VNAADLPISTIMEARSLSHRALPWRVRLTYIGDNAANLSGKSAKWWEASSDGRAGFSAIVRWGVIGGKGQAQEAQDVDSVLDRAREKERKGYRQDAKGRLPTHRPAQTSLAALALAASWRPTTLDRLANTAGEVGLVKLDLPGVSAEHYGRPVIAYLAADGSLWGVVRDDDRYLVAVLRSAA
jgi:predicted DNA-binding WGR domain protein